MKKKMSKKLQQYTRRIMLYVVDKDPLEVLELTPATIKRAIRGLSTGQLQKPPRKGKWSIAAIVSHLADGELVWGYRLRKVIAEPGSSIQSYNQNEWAKNLRYGKANYNEQLALFASLRKANVALLKSLTKIEWRRYGIHSERGKENVERMVLLYAGHDMNHLKQIENIRNLFIHKKLS